MANSFLTHLMDVSIRSMFLALAAASILWTLRNRWSPAIAHAVWTVVLCGMLLLFALGPLLPQLPLRILPSTPGQAPELAPPIASAPDVFHAPSRSSGAPVSRMDLPANPPFRLPAWQSIIVLLYATVSLIFLGRLFAGWWLVRRLLAAGSTVNDANANGIAGRFAPNHSAFLYESASVAIPLTVHWIRPKILLPSRWRGWDNGKLEAVLAHEASHVRRRDSLVAFVAGLNRCLFWFHPLAWWLDRKLALLAEQACDDLSLCAIGDRHAYARLLLEMAVAVEASGGRVLRHALSMAKPSHIRRRIEMILDETRIASRGLTTTGWIAVLLCSVPVIYGSGAVRLAAQPALLALQFSTFAPPAPVMQAAAQTQRPATPKQAAAPARERTVMIPVTVTDPLKRFVTGLQEEHFQVFDGGVKQKVIGLSDVDSPLSVGLVFDTSASMQDKLPTFRQAAARFLSLTNSQDEFFLVQVKDQAELTAPFTSSRDEIQSHLAAAEAIGRTTLLDGIHLALDEMKKTKNQHKALLIVSGGGGNGSRHTEREIRNLASEANVQVFAVAIEPMPRLLSELADETGGHHFALGNVNELPNVAAKIAIELQNTYLLGYRPTNQQRNGQYRNVEVKLVEPRGLPPLRAHWRVGYYAAP